jgi:phage terminase Nu1 subunit (DNA packaging protein)
VTSRPTAVVPHERYVDVRELAGLMGVSVRTVKRWVALGMPSETWGMSRTRRFLPSHAIAWARVRPKMTPGRDGDSTAPGQRQAKE